MGIIKKTAWMVLGALALLQALGLADPTSARLMPSLTEHFSGLLQAFGLVQAQQPHDEEGMRAVIAEFNAKLSQAYLDLDESALDTVMIDAGLKRNYAEEIEFLRDDGRVLEQVVTDIRITQTIPLDEQGLRVDTLETVKIRYLKMGNRREIQAHPEDVYAMKYLLRKTDSTWQIWGVETLKVGRGNV